MSKLVPLLAVGLAMLACSSLSSNPAAMDPTGTPTTPADTAAERSATSVPPLATATATPRPPVISAENLDGLSVSLTLTDVDLVRSVAFSPDGSVIAAAMGDEAGIIRFYEASTGLLLQAVDGHDGIVWDLAFSPDGRYLASAGRDGLAQVWDWRTEEIIHSIVLPGEVVSVAFAPDSLSLAVGGVEAWPDAAIWTYAVDRWQPLLTLREYWNIPAIVYSPDGSRIAGGGTSRNVRVWDSNSGSEQLVLYHPGQVTSLAISPDGSTLATGLCERSEDLECTVGGIRMWSLDNGKLIRSFSDFTEWVEAVSFTADGAAVLGASRSGRVRAYATSDGRPLLVTGVPTAIAPGSILTMAISGDGRTLASGGDGRIDLWNVAD